MTAAFYQFLYAMANFLAVTWDVNPVFLRIGSLEIMWYGLCWVAALGIGMLYFSRFIKREKLNPALDSIFWWGIIATVVGARLGHCLFYDPVHYLTHPIEFLYFREGGMASHGAAVGLLLGLWGYSRRNKLPYIWSLDRVMIPVTVGGAIVRFGNLINSEIYGRVTDLPWGFEFVRDPGWLSNSPQGLPVHPTQIYEALCYLATFAVLLFLYYKRDMGSKRPGVLFGVGLIGVFLSRFFIEFFKIVQMPFEEGMAINMGQILSIPFIVAGVLMVVWPYTKYKLTPSPNRWAGLREYKESGRETKKENQKR